MKITVVGTGYVGLVSGTCLAEVGNDVLCLDVDPEKIRILEAGGIPIFEPGLQEMVRRNVAAGRLHFTTDVEKAVQHGTIQFIAVGTPPDEDGSADLQYVLAAARSIGRGMTDYKVIVDKSTVPVGTAAKVKAAVADELAKRAVNIPYSVVSNPEFLKEGAAVDDFMRPDRIVVGAEDDQAIHLMRALYAPFQRNHERLIITDVKSAELTKYAANAMLATRISFMNELANLAEVLGADIEMVRQGIGSDPRIGYHFLYPGCGYGGSCFPKDVKALIQTAKDDANITLKVLTAVEEANDAQKHVLSGKIKGRFDDLKGRHFALWGLAFKPNTDDMREAPMDTSVWSAAPAWRKSAMTFSASMSIPRRSASSKRAASPSTNPACWTWSAATSPPAACTSPPTSSKPSATAPSSSSPSAPRPTKTAPPISSTCSPPPATSAA